MSKRRNLTEGELMMVRKAARDGYASYRYGSSAPVTLPRIFKGDARQSWVSKVLDLLRDWRLSPFELEGPCRAGLRAGLCLDGHSWNRADIEADALVCEALHLMGAKRPTWSQGQPEYVIGRDHCANCRGPLDDEALARHDRFCCDECRTAMRTFRNDRYWHAASEAYKWAYEVTRQEGIPDRPCQWCGSSFKPVKLDATACSPEHAAKLREQRAGRAIPDRPCKNPACGNLFHPQNRRVEYCSSACHRQHQVVLLEAMPCENPSCGTQFQPRFAFEKFCCAKCRKAVQRGRTLPPKPCLRCGREFEPKKASVAFCSRSCASKARAARAKASAFTCEECEPMKKAA